MSLSDQFPNMYEVANKAYPDLPFLEQAYEHNSGDTLADFIVVEIAETTEGIDGPEAWQEAIDALEQAKDQIEDVILALEKAMPKE